jgi:hypothetical protein
MGSDRRVSFRLVRGELLHLEVAVAAQESHCTSVKNIGAQFDKMAEQLADILAQPDPTNAAAPPKPVTLPAMEDEPRPREATSYQDYDPFAPAPPTKSDPAAPRPIAGGFRSGSAVRPGEGKPKIAGIAKGVN